MVSIYCSTCWPVFSFADHYSASKKAQHVPYPAPALVVRGPCSKTTQCEPSPHLLGDATNPSISVSPSSPHLSQPAGMPQHSSPGPPPLLMESHICQTNDYSHKVVSALAGENCLPRNGTVFFISLPHIYPAAPCWPALCLHGFSNSFQSLYFQSWPFLPVLDTKLHKPLPHQASASTDLPSHIPFSMSQGSLKNSEGALEILFSWFPHKLFNHGLSSFHPVSMG